MTKSSRLVGITSSYDPLLGNREGRLLACRFSSYLLRFRSNIHKMEGLAFVLITRFSYTRFHLSFIRSLLPATGCSYVTI